MTVWCILTVVLLLVQSSRGLLYHNGHCAQNRIFSPARSRLLQPFQPPIHLTIGHDQRIYDRSTRSAGNHDALPEVKSSIQTKLPIMDLEPVVFERESHPQQRQLFFNNNWDYHNLFPAGVGVISVMIIFALLPLSGVVAADFGAGAGFSGTLFDPAAFQPVCPASDSFYQISKSIASALVGSENIVEYGPLIASVLLRIRLELCVFESFLYEAVIPFIQQKGLSWVLPIHETLETFIAGTVFAVASNFILLGSTKIFAVILIYIDAIIGLPTRFFGWASQKFGKGNASLNTVGQVLKVFGEVIGTIRKSVEVIDTFVGRYLVFSTTLYVIFKFVHYKFLNGFGPF